MAFWKGINEINELEYWDCVYYIIRYYIQKILGHRKFVPKIELISMVYMAYFHLYRKAKPKANFFHLKRKKTIIPFDDYELDDERYCRIVDWHTKRYFLSSYYQKQLKTELYLGCGPRSVFKKPKI